jgi:hypothetical protein
MFTHTRVAFGLALLLSLISSMTAFAKGGFDFIAISGPDLREALRVTDTALTEDFFTFANFYEDKTKAPADPGQGYEILRYYVDGKHEIIFDRLHYYPETGFVFYDGIENGESEYDGEWYTANPEIKTVFEAALFIQTGSAAPVEKKEPIPTASQPHAENPVVQSASADSKTRSLPLFVAILAAGLAALFVFAFVRRKTSTQ